MRAPAETQAWRLADAFRAPLARARAGAGAGEAIDARTDALLKLQTARARCEQKRARYEAVAGGGSNGVNGAAGAPPPVAPAPPPTLGSTWMSSLSSITKGAFGGGAAQPSVEELQKEAESAATAKDVAQSRYDALKDRMTTELPRLHGELEIELNAAFACAAECFKDLVAAGCGVGERRAGMLRRGARGAAAASGEGYRRGDRRASEGVVDAVHGWVDDERGRSSAAAAAAAAAAEGSSPTGVLPE